MTSVRQEPRTRITRGSTVSETANPMSGVGTMANPACCGSHGEGLLEIEGQEHERGRSGGSAEQGEAHARPQGPRTEELEGHERVRGAALEDDECHEEQGSRGKAGNDGRRGPSAVGDGEGTVDERDDGPSDGCRTSSVEATRVLMGPSSNTCEARATAATETGTVTRNTEDQPKEPTSSPPDMTPVAPPRVDAAPQALTALARCGPGKVSSRSDIAAGLRAAAPAPWTRRPATSSPWLPAQLPSGCRR